MFPYRASRIWLLSGIFFAATLLLTSCKPTITKGDVYQRFNKDIRVGATKSEVIRYVDSLEVNGVKPRRDEYVRDTSGYPVTAPDGKEVEVEGQIYTSFSNGVSWSFNFCAHVDAIFYFDKSDKLITYHIDCFR